MPAIPTKQDDPANARPFMVPPPALDRPADGTFSGTGITPPDPNMRVPTRDPFGSKAPIGGPR
jgi:hypothetical protein